MNRSPLESLAAENAELRSRLAEVQETLRAIQGGEVDAVVVTGEEQPAVFTLDNAERPYRLLVEQMRQAAATLSVGGVVLYCNQRFAELLRRSQAELLGCNLRELVEEPNRPVFEVLLQDGLAASVEGEVLFRRQDRTLLPLYVGVSALREGPAGLCLILSDLTEQKRRERLVADEALSRSILDQVADAVVVCDTEGVVVRASRSAQAMAEKNLLTRPFAESFPLFRSVADPSAASVDVSIAWRGESIRGSPVTLTRPSGERIDLLLAASPLVAAGGVLLGAVVTLTDITLLRKAEQSLRQRAADLQEADRRKDEFLAMLAHELRNPLAPIRNSLEIMHLKEIDDPMIRRSRDIIGRQLVHLTRLVDDLLEVSRISSGKIQLRPQRLDLSVVIAQAVETNRPAFTAKRQHLTVSLPDPPIWLTADPVRLGQVIGNLLNNAAKYTDEGGEISISASRDGGDIAIRVRDSGIGIPDDMIHKVFDLFIQVDRSLDRAQGGLGIGLALVKRLVSLHGGRVEATSSGPGRGSEFVIWLPAPELARDPERDSSAEKQHSSASLRRVLVVDDNADASESLAVLLRLLGHDVRTALDGPAALEVAHAFRPDVVLCDIGLPLMDGYELVRRLRSGGAFEHTWFVALTGYGREEDVSRAITSGFHAHQVKPLDLEKLQSLLHRGG